MDEQRILRIMAKDDQNLAAKSLRTVMNTVEPAYALAATCRNKCFDWGLRKSYPLGRPTISVGNITTGGTGKTPFVTMLAEMLLESSQKPAILLRGYQSDEHGSDEARAYKTILQDRVIVQPNPSRVQAAATVLKEHPEVTVFLLDDGFQHRQAARDLDLVLIDATQPFGFGHILPRGLLREPLNNLKRANHIIITRSDQVSTPELNHIISRIQSITQRAPIAHTTHSWSHLLNANNKQIPLDWLSDKAVSAATGIGNPKALEHTLKAFVGSICSFDSFPDHYHFSYEEIKKLLKNADNLKAEAFILTEKDYVKWQMILDDSLKNILPILRPQLNMTCTFGKDELHQSILSVVK